VAVYQPGLSGANLGVGLSKRALAFAKALHLSADKNQAGLELIQKLVVVGSGPVLRDDFDALALSFFR